MQLGMTPDVRQMFSSRYSELNSCLEVCPYAFLAMALGFLVMLAKAQSLCAHTD
jgi:hypothetical protein